MCYMALSSLSTIEAWGEFFGLVLYRINRFPLVRLVEYLCGLYEEIVNFVGWLGWSSC